MSERSVASSDFPRSSEQTRNMAFETGTWEARVEVRVGKEGRGGGEGRRRERHPGDDE